MSAKNPQQVIGVGASAGGLDALKELFGQLKPDTTHASWVVVQHLSPDYKSIMVELLRRTTQLQVVEAEDQLQLAVDTIYVAQPGTEVNVDGLILKVEAISQQQRPIPHHPIDTMLLSLASRSDVPVVAIILSGTGSDGAKGCAAVRSSGGTVMAQDNRSAQFDGMPRSAVLTGCVDFVLPPRLMRDIVSQLPQQRGHTQPIETPRQMVLGRLHQTSGLDTRHYKDNGLDRRLEQRMSAVGVLSMGDYEGFTRLNPDEVGALRRAILIGVTEFFRDPEAWEHLEHNILPNLLMERDPSQTIRVWSAGCSTGEEAYSMALVFHRALGRLGITRDIKIFATDANPEAIRTASTGIYPLDGLKNIRPDAMESAFLPISDTRVQIIPAVRQYVVFAQHDILNDPPFMSLDLIICRNLLIYLKNEAQEHALSRLMYGLKPGGVLFLGPSESLGKLDPCCRTLNSRWNIYTLLHRPTVELGPFIHPTSRRYEKPHPPLVGSRMLTKLQEALDAYYHVLAVELCTVSLVVDSSQRLLYSVGPTEGLLNFRPGRISLQLMDVLDRSLIPTVQVAIRRAQSEESQVAISGSILADGRHITITAIPIEGEGEAVFLVALQWSSTQASRPVQTLQASQGDDLLRLERELSIARESLQLTVEELEASNEELQATNEELIAANEASQSTNEELQSLNEELHTINAEHRGKIEQLLLLNSDLDNLIQATGVDVIFLDRQLCIRRFTPGAAKRLHLLESDLGRPIHHFASATLLSDVNSHTRDVLHSGITRVVESPEKPSLLMRYSPFIGHTDNVTGIVITLLDMADQLRHKAEIQSLLDSMPQGIALLNLEGEIQQVNRAWRLFAEANGGDINAPNTLAVGANYLNVCRRASIADASAAEVVQGLEALLRNERDVFALTYPCHSPQDQRWFFMQARLLDEPFKGVVVSHINITPHRGKQEPGWEDLP